MTALGPFDGVIFDCDGVMVDSEPIANAVLSEMFALEVGYRITPEESHRRFTGIRNRDCVAIVEAEIGRPFPDGWRERWREQLFARLEAAIRPINGVHDVLAGLERDGIPFGVASQSAPDYLRLVLGRTGVLDRLRGRVTSADEVDNPKPAPDVYLLAFERVGIAPGRAVVIEDSATGVAAGAASGALVIGYAADSDPEKLVAAGASHVVHRMAEVPALLGLSGALG